jgi:[ribosomal protein S18]-alanine N-acetyltransferase
MAVAESVLTAAPVRVTVSRMTEHDLLEVVEIEENSRLSRWGWDAYHNELRSGNRNLMLVARLQSPARDTDGDLIAGYIVARLGAGELHVNNVAVREPYQRCGIGTALLSRIVDEARRVNATAAFLEVRAGNRAAQALYARCGFRIIGRRRDYYSDPREDALTMSLELKRNA